MNSSTGFSPFQVVYGFQPDSVGTLLASECPESAEQLHAEREAITELVKIHLAEAKVFQQHYANKRVRDAELNVGDRVAIDTAGIKLSGQPGKAFRQRWIGPYKVQTKVSPLVYKLDLPSALRLIHPVFHISKLRLWNDDNTYAERYVTEALAGQHADLARGEHVVGSILEAAIAKHARYPIGRALVFKVRWVGYGAGDDSWEPYAVLREVDKLTDFMRTPAWKALHSSAAYRELGNRWPARVPRSADD
jgi:hypothetical protein